MLTKNAWVFVAAMAVLMVGCASSGEPQADHSGTNSNVKGAGAASAYTPVQALFTQHCVGCHGGAAPKGGIDLTNYEGVMKGGEMGAIVTAGDPAKSLVIDALRGRNGAKQMPMNQPPLPDDQIKIIEDWIKNGAKA